MKFKPPVFKDGSVYEIYGRKFREDLTGKAEEGGFVVSLNPLGVVLLVLEVREDQGVVIARDVGREIGEFELSLEEYIPLVKIINNPCAWCGDDMHVDQRFVEELRLVIRHKVCRSCGTVAYHKGSEYEWWNGDEMKFDPETKEILYNPNHIDGDDSEVMP